MLHCEVLSVGIGRDDQDPMWRCPFFFGVSHFSHFLSMIFFLFFFSLIIFIVLLIVLVSGVFLFIFLSKKVEARATHLPHKVGCCFPCWWCCFPPSLVVDVAVSSSSFGRMLLYPSSFDGGAAFLLSLLLFVGAAVPSFYCLIPFN